MYNDSVAIAKARVAKAKMRVDIAKTRVEIATPRWPSSHSILVYRVTIAQHLTIALNWATPAKRAPQKFV